MSEAHNVPPPPPLHYRPAAGIAGTGYPGLRRHSTVLPRGHVPRDGDWQESPDLYDPVNVEDLRRFFDRYLKGLENG